MSKHTPGPPKGLPDWGIDTDGLFSMRAALDEMSDHLAVLEVV